jgi:CheY-like chemotaxis protein
MQISNTNSPTSKPSNPVNFMIVDDDKVSVMALKRSLSSLKIVNPVTVAKDGLEALEILRGHTFEGGLLPPYLITLDLNMPRMDGFEFLRAVRNDKALQRAVIFVLTTSDTPNDITSAYDNNIAGYIVKDDLGESLSKALAMIDSYSRIVELPV